MVIARAFGATLQFTSTETKDLHFTFVYEFSNNFYKGNYLI